MDRRMHKYINAGMYALAVVFFVAWFAAPAIGAASRSVTNPPISENRKWKVSPLHPMPEIPRTENWRADNGRRRNSENDLEKKYKNWQDLSPSEKNKLRQRMNQYRQMSPQEQEHYQRRYRQWNELPPKERNRIQQNLRRWDELSPEEQDAIRKKFRD